MIDLRYVKKLVEMLDESSVDSIEISSDKGMKIRLSKTPQQRGAVQMTAVETHVHHRPSDPSTLVKLTGQGDGTTPAALRNLVLLFHSA